MIVSGIEWTHPQFATAYYGFNPGVMNATAGDVELVAWLRTTESYDTFWTVKATRGEERLFEVNFIGRETALVGAAIMVDAFISSAA